MKISILKLLVLFGLYVLLLAVFSIQMIYYFSYNQIGGWVYLMLATLVYIFSLYYLSVIKNKWVIVILFLSIILGTLPYEIIIPHHIELMMSDDPKLSGLANKFPQAIGVIIDILFYPLAYFSLLLLIKKVIGKGLYSQTHNKPFKQDK